MKLKSSSLSGLLALLALVIGTLVLALPAALAAPVPCADTVLTGVVNGPDLVVPAGTTCTFDHAIVKGGYHVAGSITALNGTLQTGGQQVGEDYSSFGSIASGGLEVGGTESLVNSTVSGGDRCGVLVVFVGSTISGSRACSSP